MATMVSRFLEIAGLLLEQGGNNSAYRRRAVSTAYYSAFHALAKSCADHLLPVERASDAYTRVYRALEHGSLKSAFSVQNSPLRTTTNLRTIGDLPVRLQSERFRADYVPPIKNVFPRGKAEELVEQARKAVNLIESPGERNRDILASHLLFESRQS